ncbi:hypothetical protein HanXRQr2_Chr15g0717241 [Helianthus annuus]|uniref:Uncharacterized protein n=1 Tax=Helianthus annuus TaxID=4232 RepID=A0A9K3E5Z7_HELAN|nr:hypothetical protein HanXRQr2_Chr15g0717241 [Helianthus annuus]KAJ0833253.1 hypothetical protein HanPSC8_Chr15g0688201 [Helianthus annuus]
MHASKSRLGNDIAKSYIASFAQEYSGEFITPHFYTFINVFGVERHALFAKHTRIIYF